MSVLRFDVVLKKPICFRKFSSSYFKLLPFEGPKDGFGSKDGDGW